MACRDQTEAYVIDLEPDWNFILEKIRTDCSGKVHLDTFIPKVDLQHNTILVYYWGVKGTSANIYSIIDVTAYEKTSPIEVLLYFKDGAGRGITNPYIIATIPKTRHKKIVFNG